MMSLRKTPDAEVQDLLDRQRSALLEGDLAVLARMAPDLERALQRLQSQGATRAVIQKLRADAARNAQLMKSAQQGVSRVREFLGKTRDVTLTTYDANGRAQASSSAFGRTLARR